MNFTFAVLMLIAAPLLSLLTTTLTYALRELSRVRLADELGKRGQDRWYEPTLTYAGDLSFVTGAVRLLCNILVLLAAIELCRYIRKPAEPDWLEYLIALIVSLVILMLMSLALPRAIANHAGEELVARCITPLHKLRQICSPITTLMHAAENLVQRARPNVQSTIEQKSLAEEEILEAVSEGEESGVVDERQRELIESVMEFRTATVDEVMTLRQHIVAMPITSSIESVLKRIEQTGHSRVPIYSESIDKITGVLYARDVLRHVDDLKRGDFKLQSILRTPLYVPRTKLLRDLLQDFRLQKVHIAIVLDEYGGTAGLITIEDVMEQLVGDISDEHEPLGPTMFKRLDDNTADVDAGIEIEDLNRLSGLNIPDDDDYDTLAGMITKHLERIPAAGASLDAFGGVFTVLEATPARVVRVRVFAKPGNA